MIKWISTSELGVVYTFDSLYQLCRHYKCTNSAIYNRIKKDNKNKSRVFGNDIIERKVINSRTETEPDKKITKAENSEIFELMNTKEELEKKIKILMNKR